MKKLVIFIIVFFGYFVSLNPVFANTIKNIDMDIYIDEFGNASVSEIWRVYLNSGTEGYKSFSYMENAFISDFKVIDDTGTIYQYQDNWNVKSSFNDKQYKNGIYKTYDGVDLCWGISNYGERIYNLSYKINNFVNKYDDSQGIYFKLLKLDQRVDNVNIKVRSYLPLTLDNSRIWGFGYTGEVNFLDNNIVMSVGELLSTEYVTLMVRFETDLFKTTSYINKSFDNIYEEAFEITNNQTYITTTKLINHQNKGLEEEKEHLIVRFINHIGATNTMFILLGIFFLALLPFCRKKPKIIENNYKYKYESNKNISQPNLIDYYRDIPEKKIYLIYFIIRRYLISNNKKLQKKLLSCYILKWILEKKIGFYNNSLYLINNITFEDELELSLYNTLKKASKKNNLTKERFRKWNKKHFDNLRQWYIEVEDYAINYYSEKNYLEKNDNDYIFLKDNLKDISIKMFGLKKFLLDFGRMYEKKSIEVKLWNYYLIYAEMFDIANQVKNELKGYYPEQFNIENILDFTNEFSSDGYDGMEKGYEETKKIFEREKQFKKDYYSGKDNYSGGGGKSHSSGGSSSGGSSGGGFR